MNGDLRRDVLTPLRELEEQYRQLEPSRHLESKILARLNAEQTRAVPMSLAWRNVWRPLVFLGACLLVLAIVLHDELRQAQRTYFRPLHPQAPAASTELPKPTPKMVPKPSPTFHNTIRPAPLRAPDDTNETTPRWSPLSNTPSWEAEFVEPEQSRPEIRRSFFGFPRSNSSPRSDSAMLEDSSWELYWPGSTSEPTSSNLGSWSNASSGSQSANRSEEAQKPQPNEHCSPPDVLKQEASLDCSQKGQTLSEMTYIDPCGNGQFRHEHHECIETDLEACFTDKLGDGTTCMDPGEVKKLAYEICLKAGQQLTDLASFSDDCAPNVRQVQYTCCKPTNPPPPAPTCYKIPAKEITTCTDLGALKQAAWDLCTLENKNLVDLQTWGDCPGGQASQLVAVCCDK